MGGINPARLARMTGQTAPAAVGLEALGGSGGGGAGGAINALGDDRATLDGRALDSVDAKVAVLTLY